MPIINITELPTPPTRDDPDNFAERADTFLGALPNFAEELNTASDQIEASEQAAEDAADDSLASAIASAASASAAASTAGADLWVSGTPYAQLDSAIDPVDFRTYRAKSAVTSATPPRSDATNWALVSGQGEVTLDTAQTISGVKTFSASPIVPTGATGDEVPTAGEVVFRSAIVGTVTESGGVPTGAIIERGTVPDGDYIKFADGTMIVTKIVTSGTTSLAFGPLWKTTTASNTHWGQSFVDTPVVSTTVIGSQNAECWVVNFVSIGTLTYSGLTVASVVNNAYCNVMITAIGRWF